MRVPYYVIEGIDVKRPDKADPLSAGSDFYIPFNGIVEHCPGDKDDDGTTHGLYQKVVSQKDQSILVRPGENISIYSGICIEVDYGQIALVCNRSGIANKRNLVVGACVVDTFYTGEVRFDIHNIGTRDMWIKPGDKITQVVMVPIISAQFEEHPKEDLYKNMIPTKLRGEAGFGASDTPK